uniref:Uncharacterized protein n=1 Tax=Siphoviridae sp. ctZHD14 TaxID=2827891 RepID=A0A8S5SXC4_9CAUD|nr:MAG TPA: hypothetical protein [Siphoviridae sp. ctZHD14]
MSVENFIKAEDMRLMAKAAIKLKEEKSKEHIMCLGLYKDIIQKIKTAAEAGENSVSMMPEEDDYYMNLLEQNKIFPEESRIFSPEYQEVADALRDFGGFHSVFSTVPVIYDDMGSAARVQTLTIYW